MTYRPIGPGRGSRSATTRTDRVRGSPPDQIRKFSDLASGFHPALGGPPVTLSSRASEGTNWAHVAAWSPRFSRYANASRARLGGRQRVYDPRGQQDHQRLYRAWRSDHSRIIRVGLAPACQTRPVEPPPLKFGRTAKIRHTHRGAQPCDRPHEIDQCTNMDSSFPRCC